MFSLRSGSATLFAALLITSPLAADASVHAEDLGADASTTCLARVGVNVSCKVLDADAFAANGLGTDATTLPPGLVLTDDGRIIGTPLHPGITTVHLTTDDRVVASVPVVVSDVDYISVTLSADGTLRGTRWNGTQVTLHQGLISSDIRGLGIHPNGSVYLLTARTLLRIVRPGQISVVLEALESEAMHITPSGDIHIATRKEVLTIPPSGGVLHRYRSGKVMDVLEDAAGDVWTIEWVGDRRFVHQIEVETGAVRRHTFGHSAISIAANRGYLYVATNAAAGDPYGVVAIDPSGGATPLPLAEEATRLRYSDLFGLLATDGKVSSQHAWGAPLSRAELADPAFRRVAAADHLTFTGGPPAVALVEEIVLSSRTLPPDRPFARVRTKYGSAAVEWSMPGGPQHGVSVSTQGDLVAVSEIPAGRNTLQLEARVQGVTQRILVVLDFRLAALDEGAEAAARDEGAEPAVSETPGIEPEPFGAAAGE